MNGYGLGHTGTCSAAHCAPSTFSDGTDIAFSTDYSPGEPASQHQLEEAVLNPIDELMVLASNFTTQDAASAPPSLAEAKVWRRHHH